MTTAWPSTPRSIRSRAPRPSTAAYCTVLSPSPAYLDADGVQGIANFRSGATIAVDEATVKALNTRYGRSENTGTSNLTDITVKKGSSIDEVTSQPAEERGPHLLRRFYRLPADFLMEH